MQADHPLAVEQREGITIDRLAEILTLYGHGLDIDPLPPDQPTPNGPVDRSRPGWWKRLWPRPR